MWESMRRIWHPSWRTTVKSRIHVAFWCKWWLWLGEAIACVSRIYRTARCLPNANNDILWVHHLRASEEKTARCGVYMHQTVFYAYNYVIWSYIQYLIIAARKCLSCWFILNVFVDDAIDVMSVVSLSRWMLLVI